MASTNFKLFDENKKNMMSDIEYNINAQRLNGVQAGIASSQLQNKTLYQTSLVAYSLAQIMVQNGYYANDSAAASAFVGNMSNSLLQKVLDKATSAEAKAGTITNKWISPATMKAAALLLSGGTMTGPIAMGNHKITGLGTPTADTDAATKGFVNSVVPKGTIVLWSGTIATIPNGWVLCDGTNGTPDLRNRFVVGAGDEYSVGDKGGVKTYTLIEFRATSGTVSQYLSTFAKTVTTLDNRPPYYALCYIMKNY